MLLIVRFQFNLIILKLLNCVQNLFLLNLFD